VNVYREPGGSGSSSSRASGGPPEPGELEKLGIDTARRVLDNLSSAVAHPYFETLFFDLGRTEADRFEAFRRLTSSMNTPTFLGLPDGAQAGPTSPAADGLSPALVNAAIELARTASDPEMRQEIWFGLSSTVQPILVRPLVDVLLYDTDEGVRRAAANILQDYRSDPVVVSVLESASSGDASAPVRAMAQWSLLEESEQPGFVSATLRDPAISPQDKAAVLQLTRGFTSPYRAQDMMRSLRREEAFPIDDDALTALVGLAESAADSWVRQTALQELGSRAHPQFLRLIRAETDNFVRRGILTQLNPRARDNAGADVAGILEQWLQFEKDADIRESIEGMLVEQEGPGPLIPQMIRPGFQQ
jgi:HEAT repeat protein